MDYGSCRELGNLEPRFLRGDTERYLGVRNLPTNFLTCLSSSQLLKRQIVKTYVLPPNTKRILENQKRSNAKLPSAEHFFCNYIPFTGPIVYKVDPQFGEIPNP